MAAHTNDEYLEDCAFELIQQALLSVNTDASFQNGLSGIGYALLYLINNDFLDADFDELFGKNRGMIANYIEKKIVDGKSSNIFEELMYLNALGKYRNNMEESLLKELYSKTIYAFELLIVGAMKGNDNVFVSKIFSLADKKINKTLLQNNFASLLKMCFKYSNNDEKLYSLCCKYSELYKSNRITSNIEIGAYLYEYSEIYGDSDLKKVAVENQELGIKNVYPDTLFLREKINLLFLLTQFNKYPETKKRLFDSIFLKKDMTEEESIIEDIPRNALICSLGYGISLLLLFLIYNSKADKNIERFNNLFI